MWRPALQSAWRAQEHLWASPPPPANHSPLCLQAVLEQIITWLNSREGTSQTGLDDAVRAWMVEANAYLELGAVPADPEEP